MGECGKVDFTGSMRVETEPSEVQLVLLIISGDDHKHMCAPLNLPKNRIYHTQVVRCFLGQHRLKYVHEHNFWESSTPKYA